MAETDDVGDEIDFCGGIARPCFCRISNGLAQRWLLHACQLRSRQLHDRF